jgi:hypothetical protein
MADKDKDKDEEEFDLGPIPAQPEPRSLDDELSALLPHLESLGQMSMEDYVESQKELTRFQSMFGLAFNRRFYDEIADREAAAQARALDTQRTGALTWAGTYGGQARATERANNPEWAAAMDKLSGLVGQIGQRSQMSKDLDKIAQGYLASGGPTTEFTALLDRQALDELKLGGALTAEEERMAQQSARSAYSARGMALGDPAALAEVLNRESYSQARLRERQGIAAGRETGSIARQEYANIFASGREAMGLQEQEANRAFAQSASSLTYAQNPAWQYLGMPTYPTMTATQGTQFTPAISGYDPAGMMSAGLTYGADLYNTNLNMAATDYNSYLNNAAALQAAQIQADASLASAQAQAGAYGQSNTGAAIGSAAIGAAGSAAAGAAAAVALCWVAREIYGAADKRWRIFRVWLMLEAPRELRNLYREHGQAIARSIKDRPVIKAMLRSIFDKVVRA